MFETLSHLFQDLLHIPDAHERHQKLLDDAGHRSNRRDHIIHFGKSGDRIPDEFIVVIDSKYNPDFVLKDLGLDKLSANNDRHLKIYRHALNGFACRLTAEEKQLLKHDPRIRYMEANQVIKLNKNEQSTWTTQDDEQPPQIIPPGIARIGKTFSGPPHDKDVDIAIIDTGIEKNHPDLNVYRDVTFVERTTSGNDDQGHGTRCAGIAAARNNPIGTVGVAEGARLWAVKVVDATGSGTVADVISGIDYVTEHVDEIEATNLSLGLKKEHKAFAEAINNSVEKGMCFGVAAGNNKEATYTWTPANLPSVLTVTSYCASGERRGKGPKETCAYDPTDTFATDFSNHDPKIKGNPDIGVEITAPGSCIYSTELGQRYGNGSGTSFSAPAATAALALIRRKHPDWKPKEIYAEIIRTGKPQDDPEWGITGDPDDMREKLLHVDE